MREVLLMVGSVFAFRLSRPVRGWSRASPSPPLAGRWVSLACASVGCRRSVPFRRPSCGCSGFARSFAALFGFRSVRAFAVVGGVVGLFVAGRVAGWSRPFGRRWVCGRPRFSLAGASVPCRFGSNSPIARTASTTPSVPLQATGTPPPQSRRRVQPYACGSDSTRSKPCT